MVNTIGAITIFDLALDLYLLFSRLTEARAHGQEVHGPDQLALALATRGHPPLVLEDHPWLQEVASRLGTRGVTEVSFLSHLSPDQAWTADIDTAVTVAAGAIPETGSILINALSPLAFRLSLRPRKQIVIVPADRATLTLAQALEWTAQEPSGLVSWLTGPSRTADIEKTLVLGAQGAESLEVLIYTPET
ncbi:MAG: LUD domain-containing protein [Deltaproteobacteria bacterium]|nr:LUD domain-containing protein [Deltaproteobacteria bacterium]MBW1951703.1 LUD domain-containing protein [Deltaproteobacteria bacterium]MBW1987574.1 LUD domain-containing protein [Deltaproteobacteria bacterium]